MNFSATVSDAAIAADGTVYVGGNFTSIDGVSAARVAAWNGTAWVPLGQGIGDGTASSLVLAPDGTLYVAGSFTTLGSGTPAARIAAWNGTSWSPLGSGFDSAPNDLAVTSSGTLVAVGSFTSAGGVSANRIAAWNGTTWSAMGTGLDATGRAVVADGTTVYVGGSFSTAGGVAASRVATWNGTSWSALGSGITSSGGSPNVFALALAPDGTLHVAGTFDTAGGNGNGNVAAWNGSSWSSYGFNSPARSAAQGDNVTSVGVTASGSVYASGSMFGDAVRVLAGSVWTTVSAVGRGKFVQGLDGMLYSVGQFATDPLRNVGFYEGIVSTFDGTTFAPVGTPTFDGPIRATVVADDGTITVGGLFRSTPGGPAQNVAMWDGTAWTSLGSGTSGPIEALLILADGTLAAAGNFGTAGGVSVANVARWDGSAWSAFGTGLPMSSSQSLYALAQTPDGTLYAGGNFFIFDGGTFISDLALWDGSTWQGVGGDFGGSTTEVYALHVDDTGGLIVGGSFSSADGVPADNLAIWDGSAWAAFAGSPTEAVRSFAETETGSLLVGADDGLYQYDGTSWTLLGAPRLLDDREIRTIIVQPGGLVYVGGVFNRMDDLLDARNLAVYSLSTDTWSVPGGASTTGDLVHGLLGTATGDVVAVGELLRVGGVDVRSVALFDAPPPPYTPSLPTSEGWAPLGTGTNNLVFAVAVGPDGSIYAGGAFTTAGAEPAVRIARWDGNAWNPLGSGMNNTVSALTVAPDGTLYATGSFTTAGGVSALRIASWNGSAWSPLGSGLSGSGSALARAADGTIYVGGGFSTAGGVSVSSIAAWNGAAWSALGAGISGDVYSIAVGSDGIVYAGGEFSFAGGTSNPNFAAWDGSTWSDLGANFGSPVYDLAIGGDGVLYVAGDFTSAAGSTANYVAMWDGTSWGTLGVGLGGPAEAIEVDPLGHVYVGGTFTSAGGASASRMAKWDGTAWSALGTGVNGTVRTLAHDRISGVVVGGQFTIANGLPAARIARWQDPLAITLTGNQGWRMLAAPVENTRLDDLLGPLWTQGMIGSDAPDADPAVYCNVFVHDETVRTDVNNDGTISSADGWSCAPTLRTTLVPGAGVLVYVYSDDDNDGTPEGFPKTLPALGGPARGLATLPFARSISYTNVATIPNTQEGFNYVGNPTPLALDADLFDATGLAATTYLWDAALFGGEWRTWNGAAGELKNGTIPPMQGFFVQATSPSPALTIPVEATRTAGVPYYGRSGAPPVLRFELARLDGATAMPEASAFLHLDAQGAAGLDRLDGLRLAPLRWPYATLYTTASDNPSPLVVNALPTSAEGLSVPLGIATAGYPGALDLRISWDGFPSLPGGTAAVLVDTNTGREYDLSAAGTFDLFLAALAPDAPSAIVAPSMLSLRPDVLPATARRGGGERFLVRFGGAVATEPSGALDFGFDTPFPNPATTQATLPYTLSAAGPTRLAVYDVLGREVAVVVDEERPAGRHTATLDARHLATGVYVVRLTSSDASATHRITVAR